MSSEIERQKILKMLDDGIISAEDAMKLLAALIKEEPASDFHIQDNNSNTHESVFCIPGGKCYTLDELKKLKRPIIPKFDPDGEPGNAES